MVPAPEAGLMLQVTPELEPSKVSAAPVKACVPPPLRVTVAGVMAAIEMGFSVMVAVADLVGSLTLVADTVTVVAELMTVVGAE